MGKEIEHINELMQELTKLPKEEFDAAITAVAAIALGTLKERQGKKFLAGFCDRAVKETGPQPCLHWQGPAH